MVLKIKGVLFKVGQLFWSRSRCGFLKIKVHFSWSKSLHFWFWWKHSFLNYDGTFSRSRLWRSVHFASIRRLFDRNFLFSSDTFIPFVTLQITHTPSFIKTTWTHTYTPTPKLYYKLYISKKVQSLLGSGCVCVDNTSERDVERERGRWPFERAPNLRIKCLISMVIWTE